LGLKGIIEVEIDIDFDIDFDIDMSYVVCLELAVASTLYCCCHIPYSCALESHADLPVSYSIIALALYNT